MNPVQYILLNRGLGMSTGKSAAQAAHASQLGLLTHGNNPYDATIVNRWMRGGRYTKLVMEARDADHLRAAEAYIEDRGFKCAMVIDEGRTEVEPLSLTALGTEIVDKDWPHARETFAVFDLYTDTPPAITFPSELTGLSTALRKVDWRRERLLALVP